MARKKSAPRDRLVKETKFFLEDNQTLYVDPNGSGLGPGLNRVFVIRKNGKVEVWAQAASGSRFHFRRGSGEQGSPNFEIRNLDSGGKLADILERNFWGQFTWGELIDYHENQSFRRKVLRRIKRLVAEFEAQAAQELNAIPRPSRK